MFKFAAFTFSKPQAYLPTQFCVYLEQEDYLPEPFRQPLMVPRGII
jgi:hypothetical protein